MVVVHVKPRTSHMLVGTLLLNWTPSPGTTLKRILGTGQCRASRDEEKRVDLSKILEVEVTG